MRRSEIGLSQTPCWGTACKRVQLDEDWNFCYAKDKNLSDEMRGEPGVGSIWTWVALDAENKLIMS